VAEIFQFRPAHDPGSCISCPVPLPLPAPPRMEVTGQDTHAPPPHMIMLAIALMSLSENLPAFTSNRITHWERCSLPGPETNLE